MNNIDDFLDAKKYKKEVYNTFREIFSGAIKESFLIEIVDKIENDPRFAIILFGSNKPESFFSVHRSVVGHGGLSFDTCKMVTMTHYANTALLDEGTRGKLQNDIAYKNQLVDDVLLMIRIEKLATPNFSNSTLEAFLPIIYFVSALNNYCRLKYDDFIQNRNFISSEFNLEFNRRMLYKLLFRIKSCVSLADIRATDELMIMYRSLIEMFMTYCALWDQNEKAINSFFYFDKKTFDYNYGEDIPEEIKKDAKSKGINEIKYLNYGWILSITHSDLSKSQKQYFGLRLLSEILDQKYGDLIQNFGSDLYRFYKACNPQTHGTSHFLNYFEIELHIFQNIAIMLKFIARIMSEKLFKFDFVYNGINLLEELSKEIKKSQSLNSKLFQNEELERKTNEDYKNRALCSMRMKI